MSSGKRQSIIVIGFGLIILAGIILYYALSMPRVTVTTDSSAGVSEVQTATQTTSSVSRQTESAQNNSNSVPVSYPLNLNTCTVQELMTIDGIGEVKANNIIEYRDYLGGYTSVEQIKNIKGIGDGVYEKISPYLTV